MTGSVVMTAAIIFQNLLLTYQKSYHIIILAFEVVPGCGSAWLERLVWDQEVAGSNPVTPIKSMYID